MSTLLPDLIPCLASADTSKIQLPPLTLDLSSSSLSLLSISQSSPLSNPAQILIQSVSLRTNGTVVLYSDYDSYTRWTLPVSAGVMKTWGVNATVSYDKFLGLALGVPGTTNSWVVEGGGAAVQWQSLVVCAVPSRR